MKPEEVLCDCGHPAIAHYQFDRCEKCSCYRNDYQAMACVVERLAAQAQIGRAYVAWLEAERRVDAAGRGYEDASDASRASAAAKTMLDEAVRAVGIALD